MANIKPLVAPRPELLALELGQITAIEGTTRRRAINILARRHSMKPNEVYELLEKAK
jgi:N6-adenosine-specific RNA methylase IME4